MNVFNYIKNFFINKDYIVDKVEKSISLRNEIEKLEDTSVQNDIESKNNSEYASYVKLLE